MAKKGTKKQILANNRKAFHDYHVNERYEAGIKLCGTEVKSCREGAINLNDSFVRVRNGEAFLHNAHIATFSHGNIFNHVPKQIRKLLLHKKEIRKIEQTLSEQGGTVVPLSFYLKHGLIKVEIAYCKGKTFGDKRDDLRRRQHDLETSRAIRDLR